MIENLPILTPDPVRSARTVNRCHEVLARRRRELESLERPAQKASTMERLLVTSVCVVYLVSAARTVVQLLSTR